MLLIRKIGAVHPQLFLPVGFRKISGQLQKCQHGGRHRRKIRHCLLSADVQHGTQLLHGALCALPQLFQPQYFGIVLHALGCCEPWERHRRKALPRFLPAIACLQLRDALRRGDEFFSVAPVQIILLRVKGKGRCRFQKTLGPVVHFPPHLPQKRIRVRCLVKIAGAGRPGRSVPLQPCLRGRMALELFIGLQHQIFQCAVIPAGPQRICQQRRSGVHIFIKRL